MHDVETIFPLSYVLKNSEPKWLFTIGLGLNTCQYTTLFSNIIFSKTVLRGTRNLSFILGRSLLRTFETIWILVITLECSNITASKSIHRERKMRPMELSGVNFRRMGQNQSVHVLIKSYVSVFDELQSHNFV